MVWSGLFEEEKLRTWHGIRYYDEGDISEKGRTRDAASA